MNNVNILREFILCGVLLFSSIMQYPDDNCLTMRSDVCTKYYWLSRLNSTAFAVSRDFLYEH